LRQIIDEADDEFVLGLLHDIDHIAQELTNLGENPKEVFANILLTGRTIKQTTGKQFYTDVQRIELAKEMELFCFQLPCGGNIFLFNTPEERIMIDTGFGIYHQDVLNMLHHYGLGSQKKLKRIFITHADADYAGASGYFNAPTFMHQGTKAVLEKANRAYGSSVEDSILEAVYTKLINLFSRFNPPKEINLFHNNVLGFRDILPVIERFKTGKLDFEVLKGLDGHLCGQVFFFCPGHGLLFTGDGLINFDSLTEERKRFSTLAKVLMTSVNVDSVKAQREREALLAIASEIDDCLICGGHGAVSVVSGDKLRAYGDVERYSL
jgi:glyoxylase-like metal-dependent hydrolase (beta-lactamase superfamily II)